MIDHIVITLFNSYKNGFASSSCNLSHPFGMSSVKLRTPITPIFVLTCLILLMNSLSDRDSYIMIVNNISNLVYFSDKFRCYQSNKEDKSILGECSPFQSESLSTFTSISRLNLVAVSMASHLSLLESNDRPLFKDSFELFDGSTGLSFLVVESFPAIGEGFAEIEDCDNTE